ncbi:hypothetical protein HYFRA_00006066 [Hymenoscyphus fraxineus]|uniref:Major facilitator superfamily (MFS) profile domain-containing protein n=1 Tax=Hymenoscyphus fraxineus TaxID=746836 RepID=A0A9N9PIH4_9HELO|nr:hypothetical protein HYFRA_00006066 [Hymenoscyphus fraxineus]
MTNITFEETIPIRDESSNRVPSQDVTLPIDSEERPEGSLGETIPNPDLVAFQLNDTSNPYNWSMGKKLMITAIWVLANLVTCIASSIFSSGNSSIRAEFHVSVPVATLGVSLFLVGYTVGPPVWGPLSERFGRKIPATIGMCLFTSLCLPVALGKNIETILIGRFFCGVFGGSALAIFGGGLVDIWNPIQRGVAMAGCIGSIFGSPLLAPVMGGFIVESYLGWRWCHWLSAIMGLFCSLVMLAFLPETHAPTILRRKSKVLRKAGNPEAHCVYDNEQIGFEMLISVYLVRPFIMLLREPILLLITIYQSFIYGILYLVLVSYPIVFREVRGWSLEISGLPFLGLFLGIVLGCATVVFYTRTRFTRLTIINHGVVIPEQRLPVMIIGGCLLPIGLFTFAWTSHPDTHWSGMVIGSIPVGMGMYMVFVQCLNYLVDVYLHIANSALGANTFVRSFFAAGFPLFGPAMYHTLGVDWATSILGFAAIAMIPIPVVFFKYGHKIRGMSKNIANR